jgi:chemotaxis regulatin CheY-phosphate phosphatase CheZ
METYNLSFRFFRSLSSADSAQSLCRENKNFFERPPKGTKITKEYTLEILFAYTF